MASPLTSSTPSPGNLLVFFLDLMTPNSLHQRNKAVFGQIALSPEFMDAVRKLRSALSVERGKSARDRTKLMIFISPPGAAAP